MVGAVGITENATQLRFLYVDAPSERERKTRGRRQPVATADARDAYRRALALVDDAAERRLLEQRLAELATAAS